MPGERLQGVIANACETQGWLDLLAPVWVYGTGGFGTAVARVLLLKGTPVAGFIETRPTKGEWLGLPVRAAASAGLGAKDQLAIGMFNREFAYAALEADAKATGSGSIHWPYDYFGQIAPQLGWRYWLSPKSTYRDGIVRIGEAHALFHDEASRLAFERIIGFRLGLDPAYSAFRHADEQYFSALTLPALKGDSLCYVDAGAFDGDSYLALCAHRVPTDAYLFEPDPVNYAALVARTSGGGASVKRLPLAVSGGYAIHAFSNGGEGSLIDPQGESRIATARLDDLFTGTRIDFLKMDIEGSEIAALRGARRVLAQSRPVLCVSLYHRAEDLWEIPLLIASMLEGYDFFIRQHMFNSFDSVLYAVPQERHA